MSVCSTASLQTWEQNIDLDSGTHMSASPLFDLSKSVFWGFFYLSHMYHSHRESLPTLLSTIHQCKTIPYQQLTDITLYQWLPSPYSVQLLHIYVAWRTENDYMVNLSSFFHNPDARFVMRPPTEGHAALLPSHLNCVHGAGSDSYGP